MRQNLVFSQKQSLKLSQTMKLSLELLQFGRFELQEFLSDKALENPLLELREPGETRSSYRAGEKDFSFENIVQSEKSFFDSILEQVHLNYKDTYLRKQMLFLVNHLDENGFLTISLAGEKGLENALSHLQQLEPVGIGARTMQEYFVLQCRQNKQAPAFACRILEKNYEQLMERKWKIIAKKFGCALADVQEVFDFVGRLCTSPARDFKAEKHQFLTPDLSVSLKNDVIELQENKRGYCRLGINQSYLEMMRRRCESEELSRYLSEKEKEVRDLQKIIENRASTIFKVGEFIISAQKEFFLEDGHPVQPLKMSTASQALGVHESTISRCVNGKYLETDWGIFELRHFFSNALGNVERDEAVLSSQQVKERIKELLTHENPESPYSDSTLEKMLAEEDICISRRTVAKYRESLGILSSAKRKRFV